jgi:hypothetical protein
MYPVYSLDGPAERLSTLDVYGVATVFGWELNASYFYPVRGWLKENSVSLPSNNLTYKYLLVSPQNAAPQTLANNPVIEQLIIIAEILIHPEILAIIILIVLFFIAVGLILRRRKRV